MLPLTLSRISAQPSGTIRGFVFQDFNANGVRDTSGSIPNDGSPTSSIGTAVDAGVGGVTVTAYDGSGAEVGTATSGSDGSYTLNHTATGQVRVEFTIPSALAGFQPGPFGSGANGSGTSVQFVAATTDNVNFGVVLPAEFCQDNPQLATSCYLFGNQSGRNNPAVDPVLVGFPYSAGSTRTTATGTSDTFSDFQQPGATYVTAAGQMGTTWGLAYSRTNRQLFAASFYKRHTGFGPGADGAFGNADDPAAIYVVDPNAPVANRIVRVINVPDISANSHNSARPVACPPNTDPWVCDGGLDSFDAVGKQSIGGIALSDDETRLFVMNLENRTLYALNPANGALLGSQAVPLNPPLSVETTCPSSDVRPFAVQYYRGTVYVGMVCTGESTQSRDNLRAYVYTVDPQTLVFSTAPVFQAALNYPRGNANDDAVHTALWQPWTGQTFRGFAAPNTQGIFVVYAQPWLTDIVFDNGNLVLGLRDRYGDQIGNRSYSNPGNNNFYYAVAAGDILRACGSPASGWTLESNGRCNGQGSSPQDNGQGPGNAEYYYGDGYPDPFTAAGNRHSEVGMGGLVQVPGFPELVGSAFDPVPINNNRNLFDGGARWFTNSTGRYNKAYIVYEGTYITADNWRDFGKANGLGDMVALCEAAPIEIGNRVWLDTNRNGIQDAGETPIAGVTVNLYDVEGILIATAVTDANGEYYFSNAPGTNTGNARYNLTSLRPNNNYSVRLDDAANYAPGGPLAGLSPTTANVGPSQRDSNGVASTPTDIRTDVTTGGPGANDHTFDFGFVTQQQLYSIGNRVWYDTNNDGILNNGEVPVPGVRMELLDSAGNPVLRGGVPLTTTTDANGYYRFDDLPAGDYRVRVAASNFQGTGPLVAYNSSTGDVGEVSPPRPDSRDNGVDVPNPQVVGVSSRVITLGPGVTTGETDLGPGDSAVNTNPDRAELTVDFGFYRLVMGDQLWIDTNNNGIYDRDSETPIANVVVELRNSTTNEVVGRATTDSQGRYIIDRTVDGGPLLPGNYYVNIPGGQAPLANLVPSTPVTEGVNDRNNGRLQPDNVTTRSTPFDLTAGSTNRGATVENNTGTTSNLTLDFGFRRPGGAAITVASFSATREGTSVTVRWVTAAEVNTQSFTLVRSTTGSRADAVPVAMQPIPAQGRGQGGASYSFTDTSAQPGTTYSYWLVETETTGVSNEYGPVRTSGPGPRANTTIFLPVVTR
ncbi:MAG: carboxypeptidase regulatory-like domain-containing protein [Chloroflexaceae bacterium]|nr:carboxypeptidase regulatory-like domain-containing protein [Chloroflexaceae bacterium]